MKPKCKRCYHHSYTIEGDSWCEKQMKYCNEDYCCREYKSATKPVIGAVLLATVITLVLLLIKSCMNG